MTIEVNLTAELFRRFTLFDTFTRRKMWRSPAIFAAILGVSGCICLLMHHVDGAVLLGCVLLLIGLGFPASYFSNFSRSMQKQIKTFGLDKPKKVYTLHQLSNLQTADFLWLMAVVFVLMVSKLQSATITAKLGRKKILHL